MFNNLLRKNLTFGIVVLLFVIYFTNSSYSFSNNESNISSNNDNILKYVTARLNWNPSELEGEYLNEILVGGYVFKGPVNFFKYWLIWSINVSYLILNGTINVKPLNSPELTIYPGDILTMMVFYEFIMINPDGNGIAFGRAFGVTIEKS